MIPRNEYGRAFGGGPLSGDRILKILYMDEAGTSAKEPIAVVAGIIIDADKKWRSVDRVLDDLVRSHFPEVENPRSIILHAKDIFHGTGLFPREEWPLKARVNLLNTVLSIPRRLGLPIFIGYMPKKYSPKGTRLEPDTLNHALAYCWCVLSAESEMRKTTPENEVAFIIAEDKDRVRRALQETQEFLSDPLKAPSRFPTVPDNFLPVRKFVDTTMFADKNGSRMLQISDACAFAVARYLSGRQHSSGLIDALTGGGSLGDGLDKARGGSVMLKDHGNIIS